MKLYFYATTFDRITKDRAAKFVDMLSAIGGTMGLLTGFSIISGVEIVYFLIKIILKFLTGYLMKWMAILNMGILEVSQPEAATFSTLCMFPD